MKHPMTRKPARRIALGLSAITSLALATVTADAQGFGMPSSPRST